MRIIAGQYRSRPVRGLRGTDTRPTSDRLRETLFNVLTSGRPDALADAVWLDVFAGTGAIGLENLRSLGISEGYEVVEREAVQALRKLDAEAVACDFCFLDPPYRHTEVYEETLGFLSQSRLLRPAAVVIAEHDKHFDPGTRFGALERYRTLQQGDASLSFYRIA
jgi:16S rRNA (guanine966-N2)-methyltransferase